MNFLNPFALLGLAAAGIPVLLHLLNLRKLRTIEFSTVQFLLELQQTRVRKLKMQQILLLILRTLVVLFAVFALARPTIPGSLPLLSSTSRTSVIILIDNSGSMEASDAGGQRLAQAAKSARQIIEGLRDGDEVVVLPMTGLNASASIDFTRTFQVALDQIERIRCTDGTANLPASLRAVRPLLDNALHPHREIYVISDAQRSLLDRMDATRDRVLMHDASVFLVRVGQGVRGMEQNLSVDSVALRTALFQPEKPVELEAMIRNGSDRDATGVIVSMSFDGVRVAQRVLDIPARETRQVSLAAPPQRTGMIGAAIELENDAIDRDNVRWAGFTVPQRSRVAMVGSETDVLFARTVLSLPGMERSAPRLQVYRSIREAAPQLSMNDALVIAGGEMNSQDVAQVRQFVEAGGGLVVFGSQAAGLPELLATCGLVVGEPVRSDEAAFAITSTDKLHPLFAGVFATAAAADRPVESPKITAMRPARGGAEIVQTSAGAMISEGVLGQGRVIYCAVPPTMEWSSFPATGLFAAFMVRSILYTVSPRDQGVSVAIGESVRVPLPPRRAGDQSFVARDVSDIETTLYPIRLPSTTLLEVPAQDRSGVVKIRALDSASVMTITANPRTTESRLDFFDRDAWSEGLAPMVDHPEHIVEVSAQSSMRDVAQAARTGSELWSVCVVLALLFAAAEMAVSRFMAQESSVATTA